MRVVIRDKCQGDGIVDIFWLKHYRPLTLHTAIWINLCQRQLKHWEGETQIVEKRVSTKLVYLCDYAVPSLAVLYIGFVFLTRLCTLNSSVSLFALFSVFVFILKRLLFSLTKTIEKWKLKREEKKLKGNEKKNKKKYIC